MNAKKITLFGNYKFSDMDKKNLRKILDISFVFDRKIFEEWFSYKYEISDYELKFLKTLTEANKYHLQHYTERQLQAHFISPLLSLVNFSTDKFRGWFETELSGIVNNFKLYGITDFMVATGEFDPEKPYFFIQEFKKHLTKSNPLEQILAEMSVAMKITETNIMRGAYNVGKIWSFVILEKTENKKYKYYESESFDCSKTEELKKIYIYLQAVKHKYCKK